MPVASWWQRCGGCGRGQWWRYPLVDLLTAGLFAALALRFGSSAVLGPYLALAAVVVVLSVIDLETHLLRNLVMWPAILGGLFLVLVVSGELNDAEAVRGALVGAAVFGGVIGLMHLVYEAGMGRGDVKLSLLLGLFVGWLASDAFTATRLVLYALLLACLAGGVGGMAFNLARGRGRKAEIPFGPALALGAVVVVLASGTLTTGS
jgi:leader peptidase (prepilin peptidase)/N-methyltransferase